MKSSFSCRPTVTSSTPAFQAKSAARGERFPPNGGGPGTLARSWSVENRKPAAEGSLEKKYIENLQQQVYFLELELKHLRAGGGAKGASGGLDAAAPAGDGDQVAALEKRAERLREDALRAMIGEKREKDERIRLAEQLAKQAELCASQREELTVEAVGYQRELEQAYLDQKMLQTELSEAKQQLSSREAFVQDVDARVRLLEGKLAEKEHELGLATRQIEEQRKEISDAQMATGALKERLEAHRRTEGLLTEQRKAAAEEAKNAVVELRQLQIKFEHEQQVRLSAERNEAGAVTENQGLVTLVKEITGTADLLSLENERMKRELEKDKMVTVVGRYMIRKMSEKAAKAKEALKRMGEVKEEMHTKLVHAQQKADAIDIEFAKERRNADMRAKHYSQQERDAARLTAENRRLLDRLQDMAAELESTQGQVGRLVESNTALEAKASRLEEEDKLAQVLRGLRLGDLAHEATKFNDVASAIKALIPKLEANSQRSS